LSLNRDRSSALAFGAVFKENRVHLCVRAGRAAAGRVRATVL
jgi:hypothetical protein